MKRIVTNAAKSNPMLAGATVINYEGKWVVNVEETYYDAIEAADMMVVPSGYFAEPINMALIGIHPV